MRKLVEASLNEAGSELRKQHVVILDTSAPSGQQRLNPAKSEIESPADPEGDMVRTVKMNVGGREWLIAVIATGGPAPEGLWIPVLALLAGLVITGLVVAYMQSNMNRRIQIERMVEQRTVELSHANDRLIMRNDELDQFSSVVSHDLQEPLRKLTAFSDLLIQDAGEDLTGDARIDLDIISQNAQRMRVLVQDLLAYSRVGREELTMEQVALERWADTAISNLEVQIGDSGAMVTRDELPVVPGDAILLTQLYQNLISNALKFSFGNHPVVHLTAARQNRLWVLGVRDTGIGIAPEYAELIFSPFKRLHSRSKVAGTGIGLALCKKAVERMGGVGYRRGSAFPIHTATVTGTGLSPI